jgi:hypothetical protein
VGVPGLRLYPDLAPWAWLGALFVVAPAFGWWMLERDRRAGVLAVIACAGVLFAALIAGGGILAIEPHKATKSLAAAIPANHLEREVRIATYRFFQPSLVFYCRREIRRFDDPAQVAEFLRGPHESYLFVPEDVWNAELRATAPDGVRAIEARPDLYSNRRVLLVGRPAAQDANISRKDAKAQRREDKLVLP